MRQPHRLPRKNKRTIPQAESLRGNDPRRLLISAGHLMSELQTARLFLRKFSADDIDRLAELTSNADFMRFSGSSGYDRAQAEAMLERLLAPSAWGSLRNSPSSCARTES